jgi:hypothetical protein
VSRLRIGAAMAAAGLTASIALAPPALAHEQRQVGAYQLTVGWAHEPTYTGVENAVQLFVKDAKGNPIDDLGTPPSLEVRVVFGSQTSDPLDLEPSFDPDTGLGTHGEFDAAIVPTAPGNYTFHLTGAIEGQKVDERFTSSDTTFDPVKEPTEVEFPTKPPSAGQLATSIQRLDPRIERSLSRARSASTLGIVALVVGIVLGGAGLVTSLTARRRPAG